MARDRDRPDRVRPATPGKWKALALALAVNLLFVGVLVFSVTWRNPKPEAVTAELYAPATKSTPAPPAPPVIEPPRPEPKPEPPKPVIEPPRPEPPKPQPSPEPAPKAEPKPPPKPVVTPEPDRRAAEIAQKAKQEEERKRREQQMREQADAEKKQREADERKKAEEKRVAEQRERQQRDMEAMKAQAERETQLRAQAEAESRARAEAQARAQALSSSQAQWIRQIQSKVRGNVTLPPDIPGNPEAIFDVVQLPTGEIIDVQLRKSSGVRAYDDAVQRAILKSSPLPLPERREMFQRTLTLKFRPSD